MYFQTKRTEVSEGGAAANATASAILPVVACGLEEDSTPDQGSTQGHVCVGVARGHDDGVCLLGRRQQRLVAVEDGVVVVEWRGASTRARASWPITPQLPRAQRARASQYMRTSPSTYRTFTRIHTGYVLLHHIASIEYSTKRETIDKVVRMYGYRMVTYA